MKVFIYKLRFEIFIVFISCMALPSFAQVRSNDIKLKNATIQAAPNAAKWLDSMAGKSIGNSPVQALIQFKKLPDAAAKKQLLNGGIEILDYVPDNIYTAFIHFPVNKSAIDISSINAIINHQPEWKIDNYISKEINKHPDSYTSVLVSFYLSVDTGKITAFIKQSGGTIEPGNMQQYGAYKISINTNKIQSLVGWYGVKYVSPVFNATPLDSHSRPAVRANKVVLPINFGGYGLNGEGVSVGVGDNEPGIFHIDNVDRIVNYNPAHLSDHGEHVNGIVGGAGILDPAAEGMAPHVRLLDHYFENILFYTGVMVQNYNMTVTNNSYALITNNCDYSGNYDVYSNFLDQLALQYPQVSHVFAAGNDGSRPCSPYPAGYAQIEGGYQPAKNNIVVGNMTDNLTDFVSTSKGPVTDGRIKPDIAAVGTDVYSTLYVNQYVSMSGTSMASPQVAGGLALLTQRYKQSHANANPRADVLKAILLNGASDYGVPGPDYVFGFGGMDISRSLQILDSNRIITDSINYGEQKGFTINVPANTAQLKVLICWADPAANPAAISALVNDIDLTVQQPDGTVHLPLVPDTAAANVTNPATEKADHLNNVEEVFINNPAAGNYTIKTIGYNIPQGAQTFVLAYDFIPAGIQLTYPVANEHVINSDTMRVYWDAISDSNGFTVQFSSDNGVTWVVLSDSIPSTKRFYSWVPAGINSGKCLVKVSRNNESQVATSGAFIINQQPAAYLDSVQCPAYMKVNWPVVPNATAYQVWQKVGYYMQVIDTTADTTYLLQNLSLDSTYYISVSPVINGLSGYRSLAVVRQPNAGTCAESYSNGDIEIEKIAAPKNGRKYTSIQLGNDELLNAKVRNLYNSDCSNYTLAYSVDGATWQTLIMPATIPADNTVNIGVPGLNLSDTGIHQVRVAVHNLAVTDPVPHNDTAIIYVRNADNPVLDVSATFLDDFESMGIYNLDKDTIAMSPNGHWDYANSTDSARLRTFIDDSITISGNRSISMDAKLNMEGAQNYFTGTFNLSAYDTTTDELRFEFDYLLHGRPKQQSGNQVWVRGADSLAWVPVYNYNISAIPGNVINSGTLSLTDALRGNMQDFTTSFQVRFGQYDTSVIAARTYGNGLTMDNFKIYTVLNDVGILGIVSPEKVVCGANVNTPLTIQVYNGVKQAQSNIHLYYQLDSGAVYNDSLASLAGKDTVTFTFTHPLALTTTGLHSLSVWLSAAGDTYHPNDSMLHYSFHSQPLITAFPYLQNFESSDGSWYTDGISSSWQYGTPASAHIHKAASGTKAWKTNLTGNYNDNETSYLYSPCFDISTLANPMLSFSTAMYIENCGSTLCDAGYMEYSYDGATWTKLGAAGQGTNWYDSIFNIWNDNNIRWHVASIPLPASTQPIRLRFVLASDAGSTFDGIAVDDIHIFDLANSIYNGDSAVVTQSTNSNTWTSFLNNNLVLAQIQSAQPINNLAVAAYNHASLANPGGTQYYFPKSFTVKTMQALTDSVITRLYVLDSDFLILANDSICPSCTKPIDVYSMGVTRYHNSNDTLENSSLLDNIGGAYTYYPANNIVWVPYDKGYYVQITVDSLSEFWFNDGGITHSFPVGEDYIAFTAQHITYSSVQTKWTSYIDTLVNMYEVQRSRDSINFITINLVNAAHEPVAQYSYIDMPDSVNPGTSIYYRLKWIMNDADTFYSAIRRVDWPTVDSDLVFTANKITADKVQIGWMFIHDTIVNAYRLQRSFDSVMFTTIDSVAAVHAAGTMYTYTDIPNVPQGDAVYYRLVLNLVSDGFYYSPVKRLNWYSADDYFTIYPNPNYDGEIYIRWLADAGTKLQIEISDAIGRVVLTGSDVAATYTNLTTIHMLHSPAGVYFVKVTTGSKTYVEKITYNPQ